MNRSAWQFDLLPELGQLASQLAHPMHDRLAAGSEPAAGEADRVTQLAQGSVVVEGFGRAGLPDCSKRRVNASELLELSPTISDPQEVAAGNPNRPSDAERRPLEPLPQAPQSRYPAAADPGPMNPEDNRRLSVYPHVEVEPTANVCPSGPSRDAGDQSRDGRVIWAGSRSEPVRQGRGRGRSFDSGHGNGPPVYPLISLSTRLRCLYTRLLNCPQRSLLLCGIVTRIPRLLRYRLIRQLEYALSPAILPGRCLARPRVRLTAPRSITCSKTTASCLCPGVTTIAIGLPVPCALR